MRKEGATGDAIREALGQDLTGAKRRALLREFGHDGLIAPSYDRCAAKAKREEAAKARPPSSAHASAGDHRVVDPQRIPPLASRGRPSGRPHWWPATKFTGGGNTLVTPLPAVAPGPSCPLLPTAPLQ